MSKKKLITIISLAVLTILGAMFTCLASNMLMDDLFNKSVSFANSTLFVSLPAVSVAVMFLLGVLYLIRTTRHPDCVKRISKTYLIIAMCFNALGVLGAILGGSFVYHTFTGKNPFPGYLIIFLIVNILFLLGDIALFYLVNKKMKEDTNRIKINFLYVLKTIGWVLFIGLLFNRLGLFIFMPVYVYTRNLLVTFPTYLYLLLPLCLGVVIALYNLGIINRKLTFIFALVGIGLNIFFFAYTVINGLNDTSFISSISQIYPIDRMASLPIEVLIHFLAYLGVSAGLIVISKRKEQ